MSNLMNDSDPNKDPDPNQDRDPKFLIFISGTGYVNFNFGFGTLVGPGKATSSQSQ